jgi:hypothetical protein
MTAEVSSMTALFRKKHKAFPSEEAVRKDSAVHVSLSSDSPVKQPGSLAAPTPQQAGKPTKRDLRLLLGDQFHTKVRSFRGALSRR